MNTSLNLFGRKGLAVALVALAPGLCSGQAVKVTVGLDDNLLMVGDSTMLRVYGQVSPAITNETDRIFSWYVDLLNGGGSAVLADYDSLDMTHADNFPQTSSSGTTDGPHRRGIHNTFMNLPGAGVSEPVELLAVPVTAMSVGVVTFSAQHGTQVNNLVHDFQVARIGGGAAFTGGGYTNAAAELIISAPVTAVIRRVPGGREIRFTPTAGLDWTVQYRDDLAGGADWTDLPGGPHSSGVVTDTVPFVNRRYYRINGSLP